MKINLIAEFCQNHKGDRGNLKEMIASASRAGFTHGKIQGLYSHELTKRPQFEVKDAAIYRPHEAEVSRLQGLDLSEDDESWFVQECRRVNLTPMITVFSHIGVDRAKQAGFKSIKIASYDCGSLPLIRRVGTFADEIVVSTGATHWEQVKTTALALKDFQELGIKVALLHARTIYPTPGNQTGLARMVALNDLGLPVGFSDHSRPDLDGVLATKFALTLGAKAVERHFTVLAKSETKDGPVSINEVEGKEISEFAAMNLVDKVANLGPDINRLGEFFAISSLQPTDVEILNSSYYRGRVASIVEGREIFSWENF